MSAELIPFPMHRRVGVIRTTAWNAVKMKHGDVDRHIARQVDIQRQALLRKGLAADVVEREMRSMTSAIDAHMWRLTFEGGIETA